MLREVLSFAEGHFWMTLVGILMSFGSTMTLFSILFIPPLTAVLGRMKLVFLRMTAPSSLLTIYDLSVTECNVSCVPLVARISDENS